MLRKLLRRLRRAKKERYIRALERQLDHMYDNGAQGSQIEAQRARILRARSQLAALLFPLVLMGCSHVSTQDALEVATVAVQEARMYCEGKLAHLDGDASTAAVQARRGCLRMPNLEGAQDAADAVAYEIEAARKWATAGN